MRDYESTNIEAAAYLAREADPGDWPESDDGHEYGGLHHPEPCDCGHCDAPVSEFAQGLPGRDDSDLF
jgi:hypothetical protein